MTGNFAFLLATFCCVRAYVNLFLSPNELQRLIGLKAEMNYIENGTVNSYTLGFPLRVNQNISEVRFSWNSKDMKQRVAYSLHAVADEGVLPVIRTQRRGYVPTKTEDFVVEYRCARAGQFSVTLYANLSYSMDANYTLVALKQEKLCSPQENPLFDNGLGDFEQNGLKLIEIDKGMVVTGENVFYMLIGCVLAVILVIGILLIIYFKSTRGPLPKSLNAEGDINATLHQRRPMNAAHLCGFADSEASYLLSVNTDHRNEPLAAVPHRLSVVPRVVYEKPLVLDISSILNELHVDKKFFQVLPVHEIEGTFGELKWAIWRKKFGSQNSNLSLEEESIDEVLLVKVLKSSADNRHLSIFLEQALRFHHIPRFEHLSQVEAAAFCGLYDSREKTVDFPLICYRHQGYGNLKKFLQRCRSGVIEDIQKTTITSGIQTLRTHELVSMGIQILKAVLHLHKYNVIHKDVATRNCLVSETGQGPDRLFVQLSDAALSKDLFPNDYHCLGDNDNRPVKWMAYESLQDNLYNSSTDAWSFGVTLWELLSCGQQPFADVDPDEIIFLLQQGHRPPQPYNCPDELYDVMYCCWQLDYRDRPTCDQLLTTLQNFMVQLRQFI